MKQNKPIFCSQNFDHSNFSLLHFVSQLFIEEKKGVDRSSTVIARDVTEGRFKNVHILNATVDVGNR